jgi:hypothetical protein
MLWVLQSPSLQYSLAQPLLLPEHVLSPLTLVDRRGSTVEVGSKTNDEETKVFAIAKILYYKIIRAAVRFWKHDKIFPRFLAERDESYH